MEARTSHFDPVVIVIISLIGFLSVAIIVTLFMQQQTAPLMASEVRTQSKKVVIVERTVEPEELALPAMPKKPETIDVNTEGLSEYIRVTDGCGPHFEGECLRVRSGPGLDYSVVTTLRSGIVLKVAGSEMGNGMKWYEVTFDEWLRYPERVNGKWYVAADYVELLYDEGIQTEVSTSSFAGAKKTITVDRSEQKLYAYVDDELFMEEFISTGIELTPTPRGIFTIFKKTPTRYMQGPLPYLAISKYYDLPGVPWNLYFTEQGAVIHGAYWHDSFGQQYSSGCVNVQPLTAQKLYQWAEVGTTVIVQD